MIILSFHDYFLDSSNQKVWQIGINKGKEKISTKNLKDKEC